MNLVRLEGGGFGRPNAEAELPIDIHYQKLSAWLAERKQLPADWRRRLQVIQASAAEAAKALPAGDAAPGGDAPVEYAFVRATRDRLAEGAERGFFGGLAGPAAVWDKLAHAYERDNVWLGEAAVTLVRATDYDIPAMRRAATRAQQQLGDLERRQADCARSAAAAARAYQQECAALGIAGRDVPAEVAGLQAELPALLRAAAADIHAGTLDAAMRYYADFLAYSAPPQIDADGSGGASGIVARLVTDAALRTAWLDDLRELAAFLRVRANELESPGAAALAAAAPEAVQGVSAAGAGEMLEQVQGVLARVTSERARQLLLARTSARYLGRLVAGLQQKGGQEAKFRRMAGLQQKGGQAAAVYMLAAEVEARRAEIQRGLSAEAPRLAALVAATADAKARAEAGVAALFPGRVVHIIGEISNVLSRA
ncbi:hypothetical protein WJX81_003892 [Elliptochloris bilobata]|uniref:Uncharacterized protein n=1 Tax=Elliptochloris bilobata TaxID=381761 RepID=A0AAW1QWF0_9CHLO